MSKAVVQGDLGGPIEVQAGPHLLQGSALDLQGLGLPLHHPHLRFRLCSTCVPPQHESRWVLQSTVGGLESPNESSKEPQWHSKSTVLSSLCQLRGGFQHVR